MTAETMTSAAQHDAYAALQPAADGVPVKGMIAGLVGGLVGSLIMMQFQQRWGSRFETGDDGVATANGEHAGGRNAHAGVEDLASAIAQRVLGQDLGPDSRVAAGRAVRIAYGALAGGVYGAAAEAAPEVTRGGGMPFGSAVWAFADEFMGIDQPPTPTEGEQRFPTGISSLLARFVYGATTESVRRAVRSRL